MWWCKSCDGVSWCNILTHQPPGCAISARLTIRPPPPPSSPISSPAAQGASLSRSLVIFLTRASCLATVSHAIDTNYTRPDPWVMVHCAAPGVMYQYPANCCQVSHTALCWHTVSCVKCLPITRIKTSGYITCHIHFKCNWKLELWKFHAWCFSCNVIKLD